jgi:hypothetical protein
VGIVLAVWLVLAILLHTGLQKLERETQASVTRIHQAALAGRTKPPAVG